MENMDEFIIRRYMTIENRINELERKKSYKKWAFYQQSFYTSIAYTGYEIYSQSIRADKAVERLDEILRTIDRRIEKLKIRRYYWTTFFSTLTADEKNYFEKKYIMNYTMMNQHLDHLAMEEIVEINDAITLRYCTNEEGKEQIAYAELIEDDYAGNLERLLGVLEVTADV